MRMHVNEIINSICRLWNYSKIVTFALIVVILCYIFMIINAITLLYLHEGLLFIGLFVVSLIVDYMLMRMICKLMGMKCFVRGKILPHNISGKSIKEQLRIISDIISYFSLSTDFIYVILYISLKNKDLPKLINVLNIYLYSVNICMVFLFICNRLHRKYSYDTTRLNEIKTGNWKYDKNSKKHKKHLIMNKVGMISILIIGCFICGSSFFITGNHITELAGIPSFDKIRHTYVYEPPKYVNMIKQYLPIKYHGHLRKINSCNCTFKVYGIDKFSGNKFYKLRYKNKYIYVDNKHLKNAYYMYSYKNERFKLLNTLFLYKHAHFTHYNRIHLLKIGSVVKIKKNVNDNGMWRFELKNHQFITANKNCVKRINK